jgi:hypothetical protein
MYDTDNEGTLFDKGSQFLGFEGAVFPYYVVLAQLAIP